MTTETLSGWLKMCSNQQERDFACNQVLDEERVRITRAIEDIDISSPSQLNALGMKLLILDIINPKK